ncbi:hypothetical protein KVP06_13045 [Geobacter sulfurreducens]|uniref:Lipoprotein, putative n=1 Tax=Geobacter sulfurreducens (strain ATCC 51573 / DSM 12127 / PCA) TaxID=243231 RepID=Q749Z5_GEOSL|nr:lipoprotein [Geobacter sulfurreducens]AAR35969.1 lipoprotein, putative [Geobacter sulfurreducens PCA]UAC03295.1 hypothetical protein KVP06_13045 [Geobacter sulfurreducens]
MSKKSSYIALLTIVLLFQGCAALTSNPYYKPSTAESAEGSADRGGALFIRFGGTNSLTVNKPEVEVSVRSNGTGVYYPMAMGPVLPVIPTFMTAPDKAPPTALLEIYLRPLRENITFNPMLVKIRNSKGIEVFPTSYINSHARAFTFYNGKEITSETKEIVLNKGSRYCFVLEYDMRDSPDWDLHMTISGLRAEGKEVPTPEFKFERGSAFYLIWGGRGKYCSQ